MAEQRTCGEGLAAHAALPAALADLTAAVAQVLETHTGSLDLDDDNAKAELDVYRKLIAEHRLSAGALRSTAEEMQRQRDLPMARHDSSALTAPPAVAAFERLVALEEELLTLLQARLEQDRELLGEMRRAA